jgi:hypothetical protein
MCATYTDHDLTAPRIVKANQKDALGRYYRVIEQHCRNCGKQFGGRVYAEAPPQPRPAFARTLEAMA